MTTLRYARSRWRWPAGLAAAATAVACSAVYVPTTATATAVPQPTTITVNLQANGRYSTVLAQGTTELATSLTGPDDIVTLSAPTPDETGHGVEEDLSITPQGTDDLTNEQIDAEQDAFLHPETTPQAAGAVVKTRTITVPNQHGSYSFTPAKAIAAPVQAATGARPQALENGNTIPTKSGCVRYSARSNYAGCYSRNNPGSDHDYNYSFDKSQGSGHGANGWWLTTAAIRHDYADDHHNQVIEWTPGADSTGGNCEPTSYSLGYLGASVGMTVSRCSDGFKIARFESYFRNEWYGFTKSTTIGVPAIDLIKVRKGYGSGFSFILTQRVCQGNVPTFCHWEDKRK